MSDADRHKLVGTHAHPRTAEHCAGTAAVDWPEVGHALTRRVYAMSR